MTWATAIRAATTRSPKSPRRTSTASPAKACGSPMPTPPARSAIPRATDCSPDATPSAPTFRNGPPSRSSRKTAPRSPPSCNRAATAPRWSANGISGSRRAVTTGPCPADPPTAGSTAFSAFARPPTSRRIFTSKAIAPLSRPRPPSPKARRIRNSVTRRSRENSGAAAASRPASCRACSSPSCRATAAPRAATAAPAWA